MLSVLYIKSDCTNDWYRDTFVFLLMSSAIHIFCSFHHNTCCLFDSPYSLSHNWCPQRLIPEIFHMKCQSWENLYMSICWLSLPISCTSVLELLIVIPNLLLVWWVLFNRCCDICSPSANKLKATLLDEIVTVTCYFRQYDGWLTIILLLSRIRVLKLSTYGIGISYWVITRLWYHAYTFDIRSAAIDNIRRAAIST